jgi:CHAT domain-containing protein/Flp pilus assembly protein TadD
MQKGRKSRKILWHWLTGLSHYGLIWLLSVVFLCEGVGATQRSTGLQLTQQPATTDEDAIRVAENGISPEKQQAYVRGQQLFNEAVKLQQQGTIESRKLALAKYEEALKIWQQLPDRGWEVTTRHAIGVYYNTQNQPKKALEYLNQALEINRQLNNRLNEAYILIGIGSAYSSLNENQKAIDNYDQALTIFRAEKKHSEEADVLVSIGQVYFLSGKTQEALRLFNQALTIQQEEKNSAKEASILEIISAVYNSIGERQKALKSLNQALEIYRTLKNFSKEADILSSIGSVYDSLGEPQESRKYHNQALKIVRENGGDLSQQARILSESGFSYSLEGDYQKELEIYNQARQLFHQASLPTIEAFTLWKISVVYARWGEKQKALDSLNQARVLHHAANDRKNEAFVISSIGEIYSSSGEFQKALDFYNQALDLQRARAVSDLKGEADTLRNVASVYKSLGAYQLSIDTYNQALLLLHQTKNSPEESGTLSEIGRVYEILGDDQKSLEYSNQALLLARKVGDHVQETRILLAQGRVYSSKGKYQEALNVIDEVLKVSSTNHLPFEPVARNDMGTIYIQKQEYPKAQESFNQALSNTRLSEVTVFKAKLISNIGSTYYHLKQPEQAINNYNQALSLYQALGDRTQEADTLFYIAVTERDRGNLQQALNKIQTVVKIIEDLRTKVVSPELRTSYFATAQKYYGFYIDLLMQLHKKDPTKVCEFKTQYLNIKDRCYAVALHISDRARARSLVELLVEANANIREGIKPELLERERNIQQKLDALEKQRLELSSHPNTEKQIADIKQQIDKLLDDYQQLRTKIRLNSPRYAALKFPEPVTLQEIQQKILDDDTLLLTYSLGEERSYLWLVSKTEIHSYELPKRAEIEAQAKQFHGYLKANPNQFTSQAATDIGKQFATKLSQMLLQPVTNKLGNKRLLIVGDGALQYVPFTALPVCQDATCNVSTPLLANHEIINSPSVSTIATLRSEQQQRKLAPKTLAVLADPVFSKDDERFSSQGKQDISPTKVNPNKQSENLHNLLLQRSASELGVTFNRLPFTDKEANSILALAPQSSIQAFGFAANRAFATNPQLSQYRFVHFATHSILNSTNPELSGVVLSLVNQKGEVENGFLRLNDIFNLKLPAELVVLSACETGLGKEVKGEGLVGLTRGFMYAGSPRLVVSLWKVADQGTSVFMIKFYTKMLQQGLKPAEALRAAQLEMLRDEKYSAPYYWAGFTLQGEWR